MEMKIYTHSKFKLFHYIENFFFLNLLFLFYFYLFFMPLKILNIFIYFSLESQRDLNRTFF